MGGSRGLRGAWVAGAGALALLLSLAMAPAALAADADFVGASSDGSVVFFETDEQLTADDTDSAQDVYKRSGGTTSRVSRGAINGSGVIGAFFEGASKDGSKVFFSTEEQLTADDTDGFVDIYRRKGGVTTLISAGQINGNGAFSAFFQGVSNDGSKVFFRTGEQLTADDTDGAQDVYRRKGGVTTLISAGQINGNGAFDAVFQGASNDGSKVFFQTEEKLVAGDTDGLFDVYRRKGGVTTRISAGEINGNGAFNATFAGASSDGSKVFFVTSEPLVPADTDGDQDVYRRKGGVTTLLSRP